MLNGFVAHLPLSRVRQTFLFASLLTPLFVPLAHAQVKPAKFVAPPTVARGSTTEGGYKAFTGYFNRDGRLDVTFSGVTYNMPYQTNFVEVALNQGSGMFTAVDSNAGRATDALTGADAGADLNGDGLTDVLTIDQGQIKIQLSNGDGTFTDGTYLTLDGGANPNSFATGDFDGNGTIDLAVLTGNNTLVILLNDGAGNFHTAFTYPVTASESNGTMAVGDINGDKLADIVLLGGDGITPYLSTHGGALTRGISYPVSTWPGIAPVIVDLNHDGFGDVVYAANYGELRFMYGSSSGQLKLSPTIVSVNGMGAFVLADFNNDGVIDLAAAGTLTTPSAPSFVSVYLGNSNGTFGAPTVYGTGNQPVSLMAGDFYGSGRTDLMTFNAGDASLSLFENIGGGRFRAAPVTQSSNATGIVAGDFNRDGKLDVALVNTPSCKAPCKGTVTVFPGTNSNYFSPGATYSIGMHGAAIATGDLNHDGILDLVVVNSTAGDSADTSVLLGNANGTFQAARNYTLGSLSFEAVLADMNKDGNLDLVTAGGVALGKGDGTFGPRKPFPGFAFDGALHLAVADVNGDGKLDVVLVDNFSGGCGYEIQVLLGDGKGGFTTGQNIFDQQDSPIYSMTLARLRSGGAYDIIYSYVGGCNGQVGGETFSGVAGYIGDGHGTGTFTKTFSAVSGELFSDFITTGPVVVGDFNGDGKPDVGVGTFGHFAVALGNGDETFQPQQLFTVDNYPQNFFISAYVDTTFVPSGIVVGDFLKDGKTDVVLTSGLGVARLYNDTP